LKRLRRAVVGARGSTSNHVRLSPLKEVPPPALAIFHFFEKGLVMHCATVRSAPIGPVLGRFDDTFGLPTPPGIGHGTNSAIINRVGVEGVGQAAFCAWRSILGLEFVIGRPPEGGANHQAKRQRLPHKKSRWKLHPFTALAPRRH